MVAATGNRRVGGGAGVKWIARLIVILLILGSLAQVFLPQNVSSAVEEALKEQYGLNDVQVTVHSFPAIKLLAGRIDGAEIFVPSTIFSNIPVNDLYVSLKEVDINVISVLQKEPRYTMNRTGQIQFKITEDGLNGYLAENPISGLSNLNVSLQGNQSIVNCEVTILSNKINIGLVGRFSLNQGNLIFIPEDLIIEEHSIGNYLKDRFTTGTNFQINLGDLPYDARLTRLETGENSITFYGEIGPIKI